MFKAGLQGCPVCCKVVWPCNMQHWIITWEMNRIEMQKATKHVHYTIRVRPPFSHVLNTAQDYALRQRYWSSLEMICVELRPEKATKFVLFAVCVRLPFSHARNTPHLYSRSLLYVRGPILTCTKTQLELHNVTSQRNSGLWSIASR